MRAGLTRFALSSGAAMAPALAYAQTIGDGVSIVIEPQLDRADVAGARVEPAFKSLPLPIGPFLAEPGISLVGGYDSNVFDRPDARSAAVATIMPRLTLRTDGPGHDIALSGAGTVRRFSRYRTENSEEFAFKADAGFDLGSREGIKASVGLAHLVEPRSSVGTVADAAEPVSYRRVDAELGGKLDLGKFRLSPAMSYRSFDYDAVALRGGGQAAQAFRNTRTVRGEVRIDYDFSGLVSAFAMASIEDLKSTSPLAERPRNARAVAMLAGVRGELSPVISGEIGLGYQSRDYARPEFRDFRGLTFRADVQWYVTPLVTLRAQANRGFRNSGDPRVGGILTDTFELSAYHDPLPNLRLALLASLERGSFGDAGTRSFRKSASAQVQYRIGPGLSFGGYFRLVRQDVRGPRLVSPFTSLTAGVGMTVTP